MNKQIEKQTIEEMAKVIEGTEKVVGLLLSIVKKNHFTNQTSAPTVERK